MDIKIRQAQENMLQLFAKKPYSFALAGGTALELYYLHHRFSRDLDFFSPTYDTKEVDKVVDFLEKKTGNTLSLETEYQIPGQARLRFYTLPIPKTKNYLKIDFVEDVICPDRAIQHFGNVPVYTIRDLYLHKIVTLTGVKLAYDETGKTVMSGRNEARDVYDIYILSQKITPLHQFIKKLPSLYQKGIIQWYQRFSRQDIRLSLLDLDIYDQGFDGKTMIRYLENEIKKFIKEEVL